MDIPKIIFCISFTMWTTGGILQKSFIPLDINIQKNQMIYRDQKMDIWAHDWNGNYHHFTVGDSTQYFQLTKQFGAQLENAFMGHCNSHNKVEIVNISPVLIFVINAPNNQSELVKFNNGTPITNLEIINSEERLNPRGVIHQTDPSIQAEKKGDKKH